MENILEILYSLSYNKKYEQDSFFARTERAKAENLNLLTASMTGEQKDLLEAYFSADSKLENMRGFDQFRFAFHFGAQLMAELIEGKEDAL